MEKKVSNSQPRILKKKHFRVKHQKVKLFRANEPILSVFMWGINHTVSCLLIYFLVFFFHRIENLKNQNFVLMIAN